MRYQAALRPDMIVKLQIEDCRFQIELQIAEDESAICNLKSAIQQRLAAYFVPLFASAR